ncbi:choline dehydrogenase [Pseudomonas putida]
MSEKNASDYIVVGGGSAGCALASRLSEVAGVSVLLLEAGPSNDNGTWRMDMPAAVGSLLTNDRFNWAYKTEPEQYIDGRVIDIARGRVLGGSSSINGMVYTRGHAYDYDEWATDCACPGWSYKDVLPYFKRCESSARGETTYRGGSGPLHTMVPDLNANPLNAAWMKAGKQAGYAVIADSNAEVQEGFCPNEKTIWKGRRWSSARAYLTEPVRARSNLTIETGCVVQRILMVGKRAVGVEFKINGERRTVHCNKEVILCSGSVDSPKLLMLSGIGPREHLESLGIEVVHELPGVGLNLQDHPDVAVQFRCTDPSVSLLGVSSFPGNIKTGVQWFLNKTGAAASNQFDAAAFVKTRPELNRPNIKFELLPLALQPESFRGYPFATYQIHCALMTAESRGYVRLRSADPQVPAAITVNFLKDPIDRQSLREAVRIARQLAATPALGRYTGEELEPGADCISDEQLDTWIRKRVTTSWHLASTCSMGPASDPYAVVGNDLRVHGVDGLRVADASIMPVVVSANTNAACIMIGDHAADWVLGNKRTAAFEGAPVTSLLSKLSLAETSH